MIDDKTKINEYLFRKTNSTTNLMSKTTTQKGFWKGNAFPTEKKLPDVTNPVYINTLFHIWNRDDDIKETVKPVFVTNKNK